MGKALDPTQLLKLLNEHTTNLNKIPSRPYLGLSGIGEECLRYTFLQWRFAKYEKFIPRMLRLFTRGHAEEPRFIDLLRGAGFPVHAVDPKTGRQYEIIWFEGHVKGHTDGIVFFNGECWLLELKTANNKKFQEYKRAKDLSVVNYKYYAQTQAYMKGFKLKKCLFMVVNKDNDHIYIEFVKYNNNTYQDVRERCINLIMSKTMPERCSQSVSYYKCGYCWYKGICFEGERPNRTCRLCQHVELEKEGKWSCSKDRNKEHRLTLTQQRIGCKQHKPMET